MTKPKWADRLGELMDEFEEKVGMSFFGDWPDFLFCKLTDVEAELARLQWQPISAENLPKRGDELFCAQTLEVHQVSSRVSTTNWVASGWTHFRPINPPKETA